MDQMKICMFVDQFQTYINESSCMSRDNPLSSHRCTFGREIRSLSPKLGSCSLGPVGPEYSTGLQNRLPVGATSEVNTSSAPLPNRTKHNYLGGDFQTSSETDNQCSGAGFSFGPQERWWTVTTVINLKLLNPRTLQDGNDSHVEGPTETPGLAGKSGAEGCISYNTHTSHTHKKYIRFNFQGKTYQFNCLPFSLSSAP